MNKTIIAIAVTGLLAIAGCASPTPDEQVEHGSLPTSAEHFTEYRPGGSKFIGPVGASVPAPSATETASQSMTDLLLPPTPTTTLEPIQGLLPVTGDQSPQFIWEQVDLPEVENLPPLPGA